MPNYRLTENAESDLIRIHQYGTRNFGKTSADQYYYAFIERFEELAHSPYHYPLIDNVRKGYRKCMCGVDTIYYRILESGDIEIVALLGRQDRRKWL